jgi:hypothetical protein
MSTNTLYLLFGITFVLLIYLIWCCMKVKAALQNYIDFRKWVISHLKDDCGCPETDKNPPPPDPAWPEAA